MTEPITTTEEVQPAEVVDPDDTTGEQKKPGVRDKLVAAEAERDALTGAREKTYDAILAREAALLGLKLKPAGLKALGVQVGDFVDSEGAIDFDALGVALDDARAEMGLPRRPKPNPLAGLSHDQRAGGEEPSWAGAFGAHARGDS